MAERALLARERIGGRYDLHFSRWGGTDRAVAAVCAGTDPGDLPAVTWTRREGEMEFLDLVDAIDYLSTAVLYRVRGGETTVFCPLWFGLPLPSACPSPAAGGLVAVDSLPDFRRVRGRFRTFKGALADALREAIVPVTATPLLLDWPIRTAEGRERYSSALGRPPERLYPNTRPDGP